MIAEVQNRLWIGQSHSRANGKKSARKLKTIYSRNSAFYCKKVTCISQPQREKRGDLISGILDSVDDGSRSVRTVFVIDFLGNGVFYGEKSLFIKCLKLYFELI